MAENLRVREELSDAEHNAFLIIVNTRDYLELAKSYIVYTEDVIDYNMAHLMSKVRKELNPEFRHTAMNLVKLACHVWEYSDMNLGNCTCSVLDHYFYDTELEKPPFPKSKHDDLTDAMLYGMAMLKEGKNIPYKEIIGMDFAAVEERVIANMIPEMGPGIRVEHKCKKGLFAIISNNPKNYEPKEKHRFWIVQYTSDSCESANRKSGTWLRENTKVDEDYYLGKRGNIDIRGLPLSPLSGKRPDMIIYDDPIEEKPMKSEVKIRIEVNGQELDDMTADQLLKCIANANKERQELLNTGVESKYVTQEVERLEAYVSTVTGLLDEKFAA